MVRFALRSQIPRQYYRYGTVHCTITVNGKSTTRHTRFKRSPSHFFAPFCLWPGSLDFPATKLLLVYCTYLTSHISTPRLLLSKQSNNRKKRSSSLPVATASGEISVRKQHKTGRKATIMSEAESKDVEMKDAAPAAASKADNAEDDDGDGDEDSSDVELEGVDMEDEREDEEAAIDETEDDTESNTAAAAAMEDIDEEAAAKLAAEEAAMEEEARKEREELRKYEEQKKQGAPPPVDSQARLEYLMQQSDTFAHFLAGTFWSNALAVIDLFQNADPLINSSIIFI